jgi:hypothetical protein
MATAFSYSDEQWDVITRHLHAGDDAVAVRRVLEAAGLRYRLAMRADADHDRRLGQRRRQKIRKKARRFLDDLKTVPADEKHGLERPLAMIEAWIASDDMRLIEKRKNESGRDKSADKPAQRYVVERVMHVWKVMLQQPVPKGGGNVNGPTVRFLIAAANPILGEDIKGENARKLIEQCVENWQA